MTSRKQPETDAGALDPDMRAFIARLMHGYESAHRRVAELCDTLSERLEKSEGVTQRALELQLRLAEEREELLSRRAEREAVQAVARQRSEAFAEVTRDVRALLPAVGKRLLGVPLTGNDSHGLQDLLATLSPEQVDSLMSTGSLTLSMAQRTLLMSVLGSLAESETKAEAAE